MSCLESIGGRSEIERVEPSSRVVCDEMQQQVKELSDEFCMSDLEEHKLRSTSLIFGIFFMYPCVALTVWRRKKREKMRRKIRVDRYTLHYSLKLLEG